MGADYHFRPLAGTGSAPLNSPAFAGTVAVPAGSVANPGTVITGDPDTGLCQTGADNLTLVTGGQVMLSATPAGVGLGGSNGAEALKALPQSSTVNRVEVTGGVSGVAPVIASRGTDSNVGLTFDSKGSSPHKFTMGGIEVFRVGTAGTAGGFVEVSAFNTPRVAAKGSATDASLYIATQAAGTHLFDTGGGTQFRTGHAANAVNCLQAVGGATTVAPSLRATGNDTDIDVLMIPKGQGRIRFGTHQATADTAITGYIEIRDANGTLRRLAVIS